MHSTNIPLFLWGTNLCMNQLVRKPLFLLCLFFGFLFYFIHFRNETTLQSFVSSDAEGYYAYLPALFLNHDPSYEKPMSDKQSFSKEKILFKYTMKTENGKTTNKCFPGVALLQTPSYLVSTLIQKVFTSNLNGYSNSYILSFLITALLFLVLGIHFFMKSLLLQNYSSELNQWIAFIVIFCGTNLFFSTLNYPFFSHIHSFFLFGILIYQFQKLLISAQQKRLVFIGIILGFLFLVRPTNIVFAAFLLFFFESGKDFLLFLKRSFISQKLGLLKLILPFLSVISMLFFLNKWQTGQFLYWSYQGEGFNFSDPKIGETWFSYRIGIFVHHPILFISLFGLIYLFKENKFKFLIWISYFIGISYLISSWWCWDYESVFGNRGFSEHLLIFSYPLLYLLKYFPYRKILLFLIFICLVYTGTRFFQCTTQIFPRQKFTQETFWKSMFDLDTSSTEKYFSLAHCKPFGKIKTKTELLSQNSVTYFNEKTEFGLGATFIFPKKTKQNRFFVEINFDKKLQSANWKDIYLVVYATSENNSSTFYFSQGIYEYFEEGKTNNWIKTSCSEEIPVYLSPKEKVLIYIWNKAKKQFSIRNPKITIYEYSAK